MNDLDLWNMKISRAAGIHFGPAWGKVRECIEVLPTTFKGNLDEDWLTDSMAHEKRMCMPMAALGFPAMMKWIKSKLSIEVRDEELDARQAMLDRACTQGEKSVTQFANALQRATRKITQVTEKERIVWFLNGINTGLSHFCKCDNRGKPWTEYKDLLEHAQAKETELNSRKDKKDSSEKGRDTQKGRYGKPWTPKSDRKSDYALAAAFASPQAGQSAWTTIQRDRTDRDGPKRARPSSSPPPLPGRGGVAAAGRGMGGGGRGPTQRYTPKDWTLDFPGAPGEICAKHKWLSNEQAIFCGKRGLCFHCYQSRDVCKDPKSCQGRPDALVLTQVIGDAPDWT